LKTSTIDDLKKTTDFYIDLYGKCKELSISCDYFRNPNDTKVEYIVNWTFFKAVNYSFELALIIELCKLFQKNNCTQKYNINKFVNILINNHKSLLYKDKLPLEIIKKWNSRLESADTLANIAYIVNLRDLFYAHTDKIEGYFLEWVDLDLIKVKNLLSIIEEILIDIYANVYDSNLFLDTRIIDSSRIIRIIWERNEYLKMHGRLK
jgi:hypothetical protein